MAPPQSHGVSLGVAQGVPATVIGGEMSWSPQTLGKEPWGPSPHPKYKEGTPPNYGTGPGGSQHPQIMGHKPRAPSTSLSQHPRATPGGHRNQIFWDKDPSPRSVGVPTCQRPSWRRRRLRRGAWQRSSTPRGRRKAASASGSVSIPRRSDHWLQRSARARRLSPDSAPRSCPAGTQHLGHRATGVTPVSLPMS